MGGVGGGSFTVEPWRFDVGAVLGHLLLRRPCRHGLLCQLLRQLARSWLPEVGQAGPPDLWGGAVDPGAPRPSPPAAPPPPLLRPRPLPFCSPAPFPGTSVASVPSRPHGGRGAGLDQAHPRDMSSGSQTLASCPHRCPPGALGAAGGVRGAVSILTQGGRPAGWPGLRLGARGRPLP